MCHIYIVLFSQVKETHKPLLFVEDLGGGYVTSSLYNPATFETLECNLMLLAVQQIGIIYILLAVPTTERDYVLMKQILLIRSHILWNVHRVLL
jgi:hypothetical protein